MRNHDVNGVEAYTPTETGLHDTLTIMFAPTNGFWVFPVSEKHRLAATVLSVAKFGNIGFFICKRKKSKEKNNNIIFRIGRL